MLKIFNMNYDFKKITNVILSLSDGHYEFYPFAENNTNNEIIFSIKISRNQSKLIMKILNSKLIENFMERPVYYLEFHLKDLFFKFNSISVRNSSSTDIEQTLIDFYSDDISDKGVLKIYLSSLNYNFENIFEMLQRYEKFPKFPMKYIKLISENKHVSYFITYKRNINKGFYIQSFLYEDLFFKLDYLESEDITFIEDEIISKTYNYFDIKIFNIVKASEVFSNINLDNNSFKNNFELRLSNVFPAIILRQLPDDTSEWSEEQYEIASNIGYEIDNH